MDMKVAVWDTYVKKKSGDVMHFDIIVPEEVSNEDAVYKYGREFLIAEGEGKAQLSMKECRFCHSQGAPADVIQAINKEGYFIYKMEGCN